MRAPSAPAAPGPGRVAWGLGLGGGADLAPGSVVLTRKLGFMGYLMPTTMESGRPAGACLP